MSDTSVPRSEYPRPSFVRTDWMNLNGRWKFGFDPGAAGQEKGWHETGALEGQIVVPFVHQAPLSGIGDPAQVDAVWYARKFSVPQDWLNGRLLLHFGAVDYEAAVWVNGRHVGGHRGGYTPFTCDITSAAAPGENLLVVRAFDPITPEQPSGKQSEKESYGCMYTRSTGIWQTVWLEPVASVSALSPEIFASARSGIVRVRVPLEGDTAGARVRVAASLRGGQAVSAEADASDGCARLEFSIPNPEAWGPGSPVLYGMDISVVQGGSVADSARTYFGMRDVQVDGNRILLNGRPWVSRGILDQGFWPDGLYTAPTDAELRADIERSMAHGFDSARLHQKVFDPRTLYWADRLGYLLWGEFPDWGCDPGLEATRENFRREWLEAVRRDISHPSVIIWTPTNERNCFNTDAAQREFLRELVSLTHQADPSRPVCSASGWSHVTETDIVDFHDYDSDTAVLRERYSMEFGPEGPVSKHAAAMADGEAYRGQPVVASEVGGIWWDPERAESEGSWGYGGRPASMQEFLARYRETMGAFLECEPLSGFVYTQLTDVEQEVNGLYTYDRRPKFDPALIREFNLQKSPVED